MKHSAESVNNAVNLYLNGTTLAAITKETGLSESAIYYNLKLRGIESRIKKVVNLRAFAKQGEYTEGQKYWAGFLFADGCICLAKKSHPTISIALQDRDKSHLEKFRAFLGSTHLLTYAERRYSPEGKINKSWAIRICGKYWVCDLAPFNVVPRKSLIATIPDEFKFDRDFWRGIVDGDGCIRWHQTHASIMPSISVHGTQRVCESFLALGKEVCQKEGIKPNKGSFRQQHATCWNAKFYGRTAKILTEYLYKDASFYLERKMNTAQEIIAAPASRLKTLVA